MRIIVVNDHGSVVGGAAQVAIASLNALANAGHDVTFVSCVLPVDASIDTTKIRVINFGAHDLLGNPSRLSSAIHGLWNFRCARDFGSLLNQYDPHNTIIHFHSWTKSLSPSIFSHALIQNFKLVVTLHDYFSVCPNGGFYNYVTQQHCHKNPLSISCALTNCDSRSFAQKQWRFLRQSLQVAFSDMPNFIHNFISISDYSERLLKPHLPSNARIYRVRNPIDIPKQSLPQKEAVSRFAFVGRLSPEKGACLFASAARLANVQAVFVGQGPEADNVRKLNQDAMLLGWQNRANVVSNIRSSLAIVFPSLWHETQGLVVSEAAALGVPAIVSNGCAARDSIIDGETGLLFKAGNVEDLKRVLIGLHSDRSLAARMGRLAFERYWANPSTLESHVIELINCYTEVLKNKRSK
jgi:glycosyltransferase involved in cell wall biosynthesis